MQGGEHERISSRLPCGGPGRAGTGYTDLVARIARQGPVNHPHLPKGFAMDVWRPQGRDLMA